MLNHLAGAMTRSEFVLSFPITCSFAGHFYVAAEAVASGSRYAKNPETLRVDAGHRVHPRIWLTPAARCLFIGGRKTYRWSALTSHSLEFKRRQNSTEQPVNRDLDSAETPYRTRLIIGSVDTHQRDVTYILAHAPIAISIAMSYTTREIVEMIAHVDTQRCLDSRARDAPGHPRLSLGRLGSVVRSHYFISCSNCGCRRSLHDTISKLFIVGWWCILLNSLWFH